MLAGCAAPRPTAKKRATAPPKLRVPAQTVNLAPGSSTEYSVPTAKKPRAPLWFIRWEKAAQANVTDQGTISQGAMQGVSGYLIENGRPGTTFASERGHAQLGQTKGKQALKELTLAGSVHMRSKASSVNASGLVSQKPSANDERRHDPVDYRIGDGLPSRTASAVNISKDDSAIDLYCDRVVYDANAKQIRAQGHVRVTSHVGTIGPLSQLWATPDLKLVATPNMFPSR